ncbi:conserved hypothetical protein [Trichinella spiralis]|uniref:hypothetical protein n=1 Tax=Trichinella spiralis TaxID=6334 RepID=UPI0001EFC823|nr:conserved hypothetical protein [Trichinella spiralis]
MNLHWYIRCVLVGKSGFGKVEPLTIVLLGVKTDAKFSGARWSKWQVDRLPVVRPPVGRPFGPPISASWQSNVTFVAAHFGCDWQLFSIGCGAHNQLYCTYNGTVMSSFVHRSLSLPGSVELLCTTVTRLPTESSLNHYSGIVVGQTSGHKLRSQIAPASKYLF